MKVITKQISENKSKTIIENPSKKLIAFIKKRLADKESRRQYHIKNKHLYFPE